MALLDQKVALVTGAGSGIGQSIASLMAQEGAQVIVSDIDESGGAQTVRHIESRGGRALFLKADTASYQEHESLVQEIQRRFGSLHVAVNNAGISGAQAPVADYPLESWNKVISVNLTGVFFGMRTQIPAMLKNGGGSIINMASVLGQVGFENSSAYVAAKHGVVGLTKNAALEYAQKNIRVNSVGPGFIQTPLLAKNLNPEALQMIAGLHPMGRLGTASEVGELVLWLASEKASFVTGSYYAVDGGYLVR